ncbi:MAG: hypothetical protein P4L87_21060, partial [Formivibrio sp.]|nr:hypothetical protein [Formivibrio sp.]
MATYTYPGVYIQELPSGQHSITGVATSIAAFVGWSNQGPTDRAVLVESWSQYQSIFGGLIPGVYLGYAVYHFFLNGGTQAYIVRLVYTDAATAGSTINNLVLTANNPGAWGNSINVVISNVNTTNNTFNLTVTQTSGGQTQVLENYTNLAITSTSPLFAPTVINSDSSYIKTPAPTGTPPFTITLPTATAAAGVALNAGGTPTTGADGTALLANTANFETQLTSTT